MNVFWTEAFQVAVATSSPGHLHFQNGDWAGNEVSCYCCVRGKGNLSGNYACVARSITAKGNRSRTEVN